MRAPLIVLSSVLSAAPARAEVAITERGGHWTEGTVTVAAPPSVVYALATDYARWRQRFSDIEAVTVLDGDRDDAKVRFRSRALEHTVTVQFDNVPDRALRFRGIAGPPGGRARGEYILQAVGGGCTRVIGRLYMDVVGLPGLFVREATVRALRQRKLAADLGDIARLAPRDPRSAAAHGCAGGGGG